MSLYNLLHGVNPMTPLLLSFVGVTHDEVPRFRDCFVEDGKIAIYTRMGGGNRHHWDFYDNDEGPDCECPGCRVDYWLETLPGYHHGEDDDFDCTYRTFYFEPSEEVAPLVRQLSEIAETDKPADKWQKLFADMAAEKDTPRVAKALEVAAPIISQITEALNAQGMAAPSGGETGTGSTEGNSPVAESDAPNPSAPSSPET